MKFRLKSGAHTQKDRSRPILDEKGEETGRYESRDYKAGDVIESDEDLVARWGNERVEYVGGDRSQQNRIKELEAEVASLKATAAGPLPGTPAADATPATFPGGQISTGMPDGLDGASEEKLRSIAADEEIDVKDVQGRESLIAAVRLARAMARGRPKEQEAPAPKQPAPQPRQPAPQPAAKK